MEPKVSQKSPSSSVQKHGRGWQRALDLRGVLFWRGSHIVWNWNCDTSIIIFQISTIYEAPKEKSRYSANWFLKKWDQVWIYFSILWRWVLLWLQEIDISVIVLCRRLLCRMCIAESSLALDTPQNKSRSRLLFRAYEKQTNNVDANLRLYWSQTSVRGCRFTFTYTTKSFVPLPP